MDGFSTIQNQRMAYDPDKDGVWLHDGTEPVVFLPRNIIIAMIGQLPANPPTRKVRE